ncbi:hypothetical protein J2Z69_001147 [Paenibacillus shirakamiensis]|uniref:Uncharacterized protein n=1 Tax=Paenibacillus shirakamiensis TaxID=1265935 RepID=A0ABS4JEK5_9BACL|nr:hypothetical protein [Paenibacillus shirakamiensis]MBP2000128.1 hypothetical protein [Paenibacillus shirakamiensis]
MKFNKGLFIAWIIPQIAMSIANVGVLIFILMHWEGLVQIHRAAMWTMNWFLFLVVMVFGWIRIRHGIGKVDFMFLMTKRVMNDCYKIIEQKILASLWAYPIQRSG